MPTLFSKNCWIDHQLKAATITIAGKKIQQVKLGEKTNAQEVDYDFGDLILMPGIIDPHVHINEPGRTEWEGFDTATKAAIKGGITTLIDMPLNSSPVVTELQALQDKLNATTNKLHCNCGFWAGAVDGDAEKVKVLIEAGCLGVKVFLIHSGIDEFPAISFTDLKHIMHQLKDFDVPLLAHCEIELAAIDRDALSNNPTSYTHYLASRPKAWEDDAIMHLIVLTEQTQCNTHIVHLSSAQSIAQIQSAKADGLPITVETCPHYIFFHAENIPDAQTIYKCAPPIREQANNEQLIQGIKEGVIDFIATDHSPAAPSIKELESGNLAKAWGGIAGLQFLLPASWSALKNTIDLAQFIPLLTEKSATFAGLSHRKGFIKKGFDADLCVWNPQSMFTPQTTDLWHRHKISPYVGHEMWGEVVATFVNGSLVYQGGEMVAGMQGEVVKRWTIER